jgi:hypothetical protein
VKPKAKKTNSSSSSKSNIKKNNWRREYYFAEGLAGGVKNGKYGFIDCEGKEVIPFIYDYVQPFFGGLAEVNRNYKLGFIDKTGKEVIPCIYDDINGTFEYSEGLVVVKKDGRYFSINKKGECVADCP